MKIVDNFINKLVDRAIKANNQQAKKKSISSGKQIKQADLFRETFTIEKWSSAVVVAEDVDQPDRIELARLNKNLIDDDSIFQAMQVRTARSVKGKLSIHDKEGNNIESITDTFFKPDGNPLKWFRDWLELQVSAKYYGARLLNFSDIEQGKFKWVKGVDYQNVIPEKGYIIRNTDYTIWGNGDNMVDFTKRPVSTWCYLVDDGDPRSLGLLNKCAPYYIWKNDTLGNWAMYGDIYGVDMLIGKTNTTDDDRKETMQAGLENGQGARCMTINLEDEIEAVASGKGDAYEVFKQPISYYDKAINKIILGQTSLSEDKSFVGSAEIQAEAGQDVIMFDKMDISDNFENQLVPFMQNLGILPEGDYFLIHDFEEKLNKIEWADIIQKIGNKYNVSEEDIERVFNIQVEAVQTDSDMVETANNVYKTLINGKNTGRNSG